MKRLLKLPKFDKTSANPNPVGAEPHEVGFHARGIIAEQFRESRPVLMLRDATEQVGASCTGSMVRCVVSPPTTGL